MVRPGDPDGQQPGPRRPLDHGRLWRRPRVLGGQSAAVSQSVTPDGTAVVLVPHAVLKRKKVVSLTLTAEVEPVAPGGGVPTGIVTFMMKKKKLGTVALVGGQATLPSSPVSVLNKPITVTYGGGGDFQSSTLSSPRLTSPRSLARVPRGWPGPGQEDPAHPPAHRRARQIRPSSYLIIR